MSGTLARPKTLRRLLPWVSAVVAGLTIGLWHPGQSDGFWGGVEAQLLDFRFTLRGPITAPGGVAVVQIGDADLAQLGGFPLSREALASAVDAVAATGASTIALDLLLVDPATGDAALADALAGMEQAVLGVARAAEPQPEPSPALDQAMSRSGFDVVVDMPSAIVGADPIGPNATLAAAAGLGHVNFAPEPDGALLRIPANVTFATQAGPVHMPSLALAALAANEPARFAPLVLRGPGQTLSGGVDAGGAHISLDDYGAIPLVFYGPEATVATWRLGDLAQADLTGYLVFLGLTGTGMGDRHPTPFDAAFPGVEAHATLAANVMEHRHLRRDRATWLIDIVLATAAALAGLALAAKLRPVPAVLAVTTTALGLGALVHSGFLAGWWIDGVTVAFALVFGATLGTIVRLIRQQARASNLARYVSPLLSDALADGGRLAFEGRTQQAVALFVDIEGSTARSEADGLVETSAFLRRFHEAVARAAASQSGVVEQFVGDGAMIIFGLPEPGKGDAAAALACIEALFAEVAMGGEAIPIRVGAHMGQVRADVLGGAQQRQVAITGDVVNAASRLQEMAKAQGARVAVSDALLQSTQDAYRWTDRLGLRDLGPQAVRGRGAQLHVWVGPGPA